MQYLYLANRAKTNKKSQCILLESFLLCWVVRSLCNDTHEVLCEDKWHPLSVDAKLLLLVVQEVAKVNVKHLNRGNKTSL